MPKNPLIQISGSGLKKMGYKNKVVTSILNTNKNLLIKILNLDFFLAINF